MGKDLVLDVVARKNSKALSDLADEFDKLGKKTDDTGKSMERTGSFSEYLDKQIAGTRKQVAELGAEFDRTGDKDVFANLRGAQSNLTKLEGISRQLGKSLGEPETALEKLAAEFQRNQSQTDDFGQRVNKTTTFAKFLAAQLAVTRAEVAALGTEFKRTGDTDVFARLTSAKSSVKTLEGLSEDIASSAEKGLRAGFQEGFGSVIKLAPDSLSGILGTPVVGPIVAGGILAGVIAAAPTIASVLGAGIVAGGGLGLIGAGVAAQFHSKQVQSALETLKQDAGDTFRGATGGFQAVLVGAIGAAQSEVDKLGPKLGVIFNRLEPLATKVFGGAIGFVDKLEPGLDALSKAAGPVLTVLAHDLPGVGQALADMLTDVSKGGPQAAEALHDVLTVVDALIRSTGDFVEWGEKAYGVLRAVASGNGAAVQLAVLGETGDSTADAMHKVVDAVGASMWAARTAVPDYQALAQGLGQTAETADTLAGKMSDKLFSSLQAGDQATLGWYESLTSLGSALKENGRALDITTQKGQANREAILSVVAANIQQYDTNIAAGLSADDAAAAYDANTQALDRQLRKAGLTQGQIDGLIGKYASVPDTVNTDIEMHGLTEAIQDLDDVLRQINKLPARKTIEVDVFEKFQGVNLPTIIPHQAHNARGAIRHAAVGMMLPPTNPGVTLAAEPQTGGEALIPLRGISQARAMQLTGAVGRAYGFNVSRPGGAEGGGTHTFRHEFTFADGGATDLERSLSDAFMGLVRKGKIQVRTT